LARIRLATLVLALATSGLAYAEASPDRRYVGLGWNAAVGFLAGDGDIGPLWEAGSFELRLFPSDRVSIDLQWDIAGMIRARAESDIGLYAQRTYVHVHVRPRARASLAVAPYVLTHIGAARGGGVYGNLGLGARVGVDLLAPRRTFGLGIYGRPGLLLVGVVGARPAAGFALVVEVTWTFYPVPRGEA